MQLALFFALLLTASIASADPRFSVIGAFGRDGSGASQLDNPWRMAVDQSNGDIAVADTAKHRVVIFDRNGRFKASFGIEGDGPGQLQAPCAVAFLPGGREILVSDTGNNRIDLFDRAGRFIRTFVQHGSDIGQVTKPTGLAIAPSGDIFVSDSGNNRIQVFSSSGTPLRSFGSQGSAPGQFELPYDVAIHPDGARIAVADYGNHRVQIMDIQGRFLRIIGGFGITPGKFWGASGVAYTRDGTLLVADAANRRVQWFDLAKGTSGKFGEGGDAPGQFIQAHAVATDQRNGMVYVSDFYLNRVQAFQDANAPPLSLQAHRFLPAICASMGTLFLAGLFIWRRQRTRQYPRKSEMHAGFTMALIWNKRPKIPTEWLLLAGSLTISLLLNHTFWSTAATSLSGERILSGVWLAPAALLMVAVQFALLVLLVPRALAKPSILLLVSLAAAIDFYMRRYHIYLDVTMMQNVLSTDRVEARQQLTKSALVYIALWTIGSALTLSFIQLRTDVIAVSLKRRARYLAAAIILTLCCLVVLHGRLRELIREKPETMLLVNPASALVNLPRAYFSGALPTKGALTPIGTDAIKSNTAIGLPRLFVVIVGESTRGASWGLNGYKRDTTPELRRAGVVNFPDVTSCGSNDIPPTFE